MNSELLQMYESPRNAGAIAPAASATQARRSQSSARASGGAAGTSLPIKSGLLRKPLLEWLAAPAAPSVVWPFGFDTFAQIVSNMVTSSRWQCTPVGGIPMKRFGVLVLCTVAAATLTASRSQAALTPSLETAISTILSSSGIDPSTLVTGITGTATSVSVTSTAGSLTILNPTTPGATVKPGD